ncbi:MAG: NPCBM/NEW2 domain-containing protein, partial [Kiritimatiellaeota bacterium]|nr:NPCBM/NEW2 domain-containing protein [Kiritimatiellota bacterium]
MDGKAIRRFGDLGETALPASQQAMTMILEKPPCPGAERLASLHRRVLPYVIAVALSGLLPLLAQDPVAGKAPVRTHVVRGGDEPVKMVVDITGVQTLFLAASNGGDTYNYDQAVWCEPKLFAADGKEIDMVAMDYMTAKFGWGDVSKRGVKVGSRTFEKAWYAHAPSVLKFNVAKHNAVRFEAWVGIESGSGKNGSSEFIVAAEEPGNLGSEPMSEMEFTEQVEMPPAANLPIAEAKVTFNADAAKPLLAKGVHQLLFVRRFNLTSSHFYTEFLDAKWNPGGSLCVLNLETGAVTEITPEEMRKGVINRFDLSWDAKKVVFDYKGGAREPYCIYEIGVDGEGLRQLTFPTPDNDALLKRYNIRPDDMHPCYLQDGSIVFSSSRCLTSTLCDSGDGFKTTVLHRMDADGQNIRQLSFNVLSEFSPAVLPDGRVLYMRWEYNRKDAGAIKCLWSMRPDGSGTAEVYGDNILDPETMLYGRPIPGSDKISFLGCTHWGPNNAVGTLIVLDPKADVASTNAMRFVTPDVMALSHDGFSFLMNGKYVHDRTGRQGRLFKDPYPLSEDLFLVSLKPKGVGWEIANGYHLATVDGDGRDTPLLKDDGMGCWHPYPLLPRTPPPPPPPRPARAPAGPPLAPPPPPPRGAAPGGGPPPP